MKALFARVRSFWRGLWRPDQLWAEMDEEMRFHVDMEAERLQRERGLDPAEARRQAAAAFGGVEKYREAGRDARGLGWLSGLTLDLKLGGRMLVKYPGLTVIGALAMAFAIWVGVVVFEMVMLFVSPALPLPGGDRIVHLRNWDVQASEPEPRALHDFVVWRQTMRTVTDLGAWEDVTRNLMGRDGEVLPVQVAAITASGFRLAPTPPLLGRTLVPADEQPGAPPVVVLGHDVWQARFAGDPAIVGQTVQLGNAYATVVGVMPDGFTFPVAHDAWTPFRPSVLDDAPLSGPGITIFGRLAPGATLGRAQAELAALGRRAVRERPDTHQHLRPQVMPYAQMFGGASTMEADELGAFALMQTFVLMLLVLVCGNVALLLFARAATRESEIIVRSALGASRRRIVVQLFAEALVLGGVAAAVGLAAAHLALRQWAMPFLEANMGRIPFWYDPRLSPATVLYACALTLLGAAIAGGLPGLKVTRGLGSRLRAGTTVGGGLRFGGVWTAVIVAQVAVTVAFPAVVLAELDALNRMRSYDVGFAAEEYLAVSLAMETPPGVDADSATMAGHHARFGMLVEALRQRVAAEPGVVGVTFVDKLPLTNYGGHRIALDDAAAVAEPSGAADAPEGQRPLRYTKVGYVDPSYFDVLEAPILAGRGFGAADLAPGNRVVIVDQGFVDQVLRGQNPIGRRVRIGGGTPPDGRGADSLPWHEIVGVVKDLGMTGAGEDGRAAGLYLPGTPGSGFPPHMVIHARGDPMTLAPRVRAIAGSLDPTLRLSGFQRVDQVTGPRLWMLGMWIRMTLGMTAVALLLSLAGIYAVMSFTVARRTREIGVRVALGAKRRSVLTAIFRRPLTQVGLGVAAGATLIALGALALSRAGELAGPPGGFSAGQVALLVAYAAFMLGVCLLACVVPTRRALRVEPMVAMRVE
jgi:predicted permease